MARILDFLKSYSVESTFSLDLDNMRLEEKYSNTKNFEFLR
jgi:hypothetical protein